MKLLCRLGWHEYAKWEDNGEVLVKILDDDNPDYPPVTMTFERQKRECAHCGIKKIRRERK